jgi:hypothetical protein
MVRFIAGDKWIAPKQRQALEEAILTTGSALTFVDLPAGQGPYNSLEDRLAPAADLTVLVSAMLWEHLSARYPESFFPNAVVVTGNAARMDTWPIKAAAVVAHNKNAPCALKATLLWLLNDPVPASRSSSRYLRLRFGWILPSPAQEAYALRAWNFLVAGFAADRSLSLPAPCPSDASRELSIRALHPYSIRVTRAADEPPVTVSKPRFLDSAVQWAKSRATGAPLFGPTWVFKPDPCVVEILTALEKHPPSLLHSSGAA